jgi:uncharacterized integral membrane protein (TIGR00697 family)
MSGGMSAKQRRDLIFLGLSGIFITNALLGELIGGKLFQIGPATFSLGVLPWPVVFITTDLINEFFGKDGVKRLTYMTVALVIYAFIILFLGMGIPAASFSPVNDASFSNVFGQSMWIIVGSVIAFITSQFVDVGVFWLLRANTGGKHLWLRSTGSTAVSQLIDTFVIMGIAFYMPGKLTFSEYLSTSAGNYGYKLLIAVGLTPLIYAGHGIIDKFLGEEESHHLIDQAVHASLDKP